MAKARQPQSGQVQLRITSLLDVVFQLIIFFLLVTNFSAAELPKVKLPDVYNSQAQELGKRKRVIVNVVPPDSQDGSVKEIRVGIKSLSPDPGPKLTELLKAEGAKGENVQVDLRAGRSVHYKNVQPVMSAVTAAGIKRINLRLYTKEQNSG